MLQMLLQQFSPFARYSTGDASWKLRLRIGDKRNRRGSDFSSYYLYFLRTIKTSITGDYRGN